MKFLKYSHISDIDIDSNSIPFHDDNKKVKGYIINGTHVAIRVNGINDLYCIFVNDDNKELTKDYLLSFALNISAFIKSTNRIFDSHIIDKKYIESCLIHNSIAEMFAENDCTELIQSISLSLSPNYSNNAFHIKFDDKHILSLNNENSAKRLFIILKCSLLRYLKSLF